MSRLNQVVDVFKQDAQADATILRVARGAPQFRDSEQVREILAKNTDAQLREAYGLSRKELHVMMHALMPKTATPVYLMFAHERTVALAKTLPTDGEGEGANGFAIPVRAEDVREVEPENEDDDE